jgi:hypothetical protein
MLDLVRLAGFGRVVTNCDRHSGLIAQRLEVQLPGALPVSVAASAIGAVQEPSGTAVVTPAIHPPPAANALYRKLCCLMRHPYVHYRSISSDIVSPIGKGLMY